MGQYGGGFDGYPQTATNRLCGLCLFRAGTTARFLFARHRAKKEQQVALLL